MQPIVENSVNHGIALKPEGGLVSVEATITDKRVHIRVTDSGAGWNATGGEAGVGLDSASERSAAGWSCSLAKKRS